MAELELNKIVNMIMENPELVEKIRSLGEEGAVSAPEEKPQQESVVADAPLSIGKNTKRRELLGALKAFLSEERQKSLDSILNMADVFDAVRKK